MSSVETHRYAKIFITITLIYAIVMLIHGSAIIKPRQPPTSGDPKAWLEYYFSIILSFIVSIFHIVTFSFIPYPYNYIISLPMLGLYAYSLIMLLKDILYTIMEFVRSVKPL